jgi:hypothetical protein
MTEIPPGPLEREPTPLFLPRADLQLMLERALGPIDIGTWDRRIVAWLAGLDTSTVRTLASLIVRARDLGGGSG